MTVITFSLINDLETKLKEVEKILKKKLRTSSNKPKQSKNSNYKIYLNAILVLLSKEGSLKKNSLAAMSRDPMPPLILDKLVLKNMETMIEYE